MVTTQRKTGITDEAVVETGGTALGDEADINISSASHDVSLPSDLVASVGSDAGFVARNDGPIEVSGDLTLRAINLKPLQLMGAYSEPDSSTWQIRSQNTLPEHQFKQQVTDSHILVLSGYDDSGSEPTVSDGLKFDSCTISISKDEMVEMDFSGTGTYAEVQSGSVTTNYATVDPSNWLDVGLEIDGTAVGSIESAEISIERSAEAVRGIEQRDANFRLLPSEVIEKMRDISVDLTIEITDTTAWEKAFDDNSAPFKPSDDRSEHTVTMVLGNRSDDTDTNLSHEGELKLTGVQFENPSGSLEDDAEVRTVSLSGNARDWQVDGEL